MGDISFKTINITSVCSTKIARNNFLNFKRSQYVLKLRINSLQKKSTWFYMYTILWHVRKG